MEMSIQPLPDDVIAQIKSSTTITSLNGVIYGLVQNALDAEATKINVSVDYTRGSCLVEDNGLGIPPSEFQPIGGLGKLHWTSRFPPQDTLHGKHGMFLAALASLSLLSLTSHHHAHYSHNSIRIHNSDVVARHIPSPADHRILTFAHGTRVTVRDLFGSMPVRIKQRALEVERGAIQGIWESLKCSLISLVLAWPGPLSLSIRDNVNHWSTSIRSPDFLGTRQQRKQDALHLVQRVSSVLYQAHLSDENYSSQWVPLKASLGSISVEGAVSLYPVATKKAQFISIGVQPVFQGHGSNILYEQINRVFANSSFGVEEESSELNEEEQRRKIKDHRFKQDGYTNQELKGRKGVDRWPMFYVKVNLTDDSPLHTGRDIDEVLDERQGGLADIIELLKAMSYEFLKKHHFRPKHSRHSKASLGKRRDSTARRNTGNSTKWIPTATRENNRPSLAQNRPSSGDVASVFLSTTRDQIPQRAQSPFNFWTRVKSGQPQITNDERRNVKEKDRRDSVSCHDASENALCGSQTDPHTQLLRSDGTLLRAPFADLEDSAKDRRQDRTDSRASETVTEGGIPWTDPSTSQKTIINSINGFTMRPTKESSNMNERGSENQPRTSKKKIRMDTRPSPGADKIEWLSDLLSSWDNPVFQATEPPIPTTFDESRICEVASNSLAAGCHGKPFASFSAPSVQGRVSKDALRNAEVIAQVDKKFILAKVLSTAPDGQTNTPGGYDSSLLIIIDQHAADERCRVEELMKNYFHITDVRSSMKTGSSQGRSLTQSTAVTAVTENLERPIIFHISTQEVTRFEHAKKRFHHWGIAYKVTSTSQADARASARLEITDLPSSISARCRLEPRLLIELLRKEAWTF